MARYTRRAKGNKRFIRTKRTELKRLFQRGCYDRRIIYRILDEGFICHVGFINAGHPVVIPTAYGRLEDVLYIHGSAASRMLRKLADGIQVCVTVTLVDGLVLARSAFHHSMNYRSVVLFGTASRIHDVAAKMKALRAFSDHIIPGRWEDVRKPSYVELKQTLVLQLLLTEVSAKIRTGPPIDEETDYKLGVWAGELPLSVIAREPIADSRLVAGIEVPAYIQTIRRIH